MVLLDAWALERLDGLARMNEQLYGSPCSSLDRTRKTWYTFADGERPQSERVVAFQVNVGGKMGDCKIANLNATGVPILLSVQSISKMEAIMGFSTGATFFRNLTDQVFAQTGARGKLTSLCVTVKDMLSQSICDKDQLLGFQAAARVREILAKRDRTLRLHTQTEGQVNCKKETQMAKRVP